MLFYFTVIVGTDVIDAERQLDTASLESARAAARALLGRLAAERLSKDDCDMLSVEIFDDAKAPVTELRLVFQELEKRGL